MRRRARRKVTTFVGLVVVFLTLYITYTYSLHRAVQDKLTRHRPSAIPETLSNNNIDMHEDAVKLPTTVIHDDNIQKNGSIRTTQFPAEDDAKDVKLNVHEWRDLAIQKDQIINIKQEAYVKLPDYDIFIHRAVLGNTSIESHWDLVTITGWWFFDNDVKHFVCCLLYSDGVLIRTNLLPYRHVYMYEVPLEGKLVQSRNPRYKDAVLPVGVALAHESQKCSLNVSMYVPPFRARTYETKGKIGSHIKTDTGSIGLCTKVAYGNLSAALLIDWFEVHRHYGINTVITYLDKTLNKAAKRVFEYYESVGILTTYPYEVPFQDEIRRTIGDKNPQSWSDENLSTLDCQERLRGHNYVGVLDFDEFLVPSKSSSIQALMNDLLKTHSDAAGFTFESVIFLNEWGQGKTDGLSPVSSIRHRTRPMDDRRKYLAVIDRVQRGTMFTHEFRPLKGYKQYKCPDEMTVLRHYRSCRKSWLKNGTCLSNHQKIYDDTVLKIVEKLKPNILEARSAIMN